MVPKPGPQAHLASIAGEKLSVHGLGRLVDHRVARRGLLRVRGRLRGHRCASPRRSRRLRAHAHRMDALCLTSVQCSGWCAQRSAVSRQNYLIRAGLAAAGACAEVRHGVSLAHSVQSDPMSSCRIRVHSAEAGACALMCMASHALFTTTAPQALTLVRAKPHCSTCLRACAQGIRLAPVRLAHAS